MTRIGRPPIKEAMFSNANVLSKAWIRYFSNVVDIKSIADVILGTVNQITVTDNRNGTITLSIPSTAQVETLGVGATATQIFTVNEKSGMTSIGGYIIKLTNKTGAATVVGQIVEASTSIDSAFGAIAASDTHPIGVVLEAGVGDGSEAWIVVSGIADVLIDAGGCTRGDRLITSATAGSADVNNAPTTAQYLQVIGHSIESRAGAGLAKAVLNFL